MQETPAAEKEVPAVIGKGIVGKPTPVPTELVPAVIVPAVPVSGEQLAPLSACMLLGTSRRLSTADWASFEASQGLAKPAFAQFGRGAEGMISSSWTKMHGQHCPSSLLHPWTHCAAAWHISMVKHEHQPRPLAHSS